MGRQRQFHILSLAVEVLLLLGSALFFYSFAGILLFGCAAQKPIKAQVVVPRDCMTSVELTDKAECHGDDVEHLHCTGFKLTKRQGCEQLSVSQPAKKGK